MIVHACFMDHVLALVVLVLELGDPRTHLQPVLVKRERRWAGCLGRGTSIRREEGGEGGAEQ